MQIMAIFYSIIYIQYGAYTHHIIIGHSCVEYKEEVFVMIVYDRLWIEYYGAAEPPVRCGESHLSGLTEPLRSL
mgnify:CR=1 FL=1